ncbi:mitochondrial glutamate carrier 1-like [Rhopilema esculentum]|uniref:mitochondrial glutamate carrier 1-like n=1 Tax=Rhopilema esculentum TaxID=499914 RepID=UPI0031D5DE1B|eukprot:gene5111-231_t
MESSFVAKLLNGAIAGSVGTACIFPLDLAKTRLQDQRTVAKAGSQQVKKLYKNVFHCIYVVARTEGIRGLYKGLGVNILLVNPEKAIKLAVNDQTRVFFGGRTSFLPLQYEMLAGALAGFCQVSVTTPMEFLKIQMQVSGRNKSVLAADGSAVSTSATQVAANLIKQNGIGAVYRGLGATFARDVPFSCIYFPLFAYINIKGYGADGSRPHPLHSLFAGLFSGMTASLAVNPLDVIKTRLQVLKRVEGEPTYNGIIDCAVKVFKQEGITAFYKGAIPRIIVIAPLFGIAQMVYFFGVAETLIGYTQPKKIAGRDFK